VRLSYFLPHVINAELTRRNEIRRIIDKTLEFNQSAKDALELALDDLEARCLNLPVYSLYGGSQNTLKRCGSIDLVEPAGARRHA